MLKAVYVSVTFLPRSCRRNRRMRPKIRSKMVVRRMESRSRRCREAWPRQESCICSVLSSSSFGSFAFHPSRLCLSLLSLSSLIYFDLLLLSLVSLPQLTHTHTFSLSPLLYPFSTWCCSGTNLPTPSRFYLPASQRPYRIRAGPAWPFAGPGSKILRGLNQFKLYT